MILGMIDLTTHDEKTLRAIEGQVLDDSKNTIITKEEDELFLSSLSRIISLTVNKYEVKDKQFSVFSPVMKSNILPVKASL